MREIEQILSKFSKGVVMGGQFTKRETDNILKKKQGGQDTSIWMKHSKRFRQRSNFKGEAIFGMVGCIEDLGVRDAKEQRHATS